LKFLKKPYAPFLKRMYKHLTCVVYISVALMAPTAAHAAVVISEIAWMGTSVSANAEWIELQNTDSASVSLAGWTLVSSTGSPAISLTGSIAGSGFYLLERTSDASVPSVSADQIYSGALPNTGLTLTLKDATLTAVDTVAGGVDWKSIGGDNITKQTPQRSGTAWSTAEATPKTANNAGTGSGDSGGATASSTDPLIPQPSIGGSTVSSGSSANPIPRLYVDAGPGRILTAGAEVPFTAYAYDSDGSVRKDADLSWSFGDGAGADGDEVIHGYILPGSYTVSVHAAVGSREVVSLLAVKVIAPVVSIISANAEGITLKNASENLLDLSSWKLSRDDTDFIVPKYTALLPGQTVTFPTQIIKLGTSTATTKLLFPDGRDVATFEAVVASTTPELVSSIEAIEPIILPEQETRPQPLASRVGIQEVEENTPQLVPTNSSIYDPQTRAPSTLANPSVLGASVGSAVPKLLTSPWTASFMGLLVAAATILVIL
jgi:hypothetical protein